MKKNFIIGMLLTISMTVSASDFQIGESVLKSRDTGQQEWAIKTAEIVAQNGEVLKLAEEKTMLNYADEIISFKPVSAIKVHSEVIKTGDVVLYKPFDYNDILYKTVVARLVKSEEGNLAEIDEEGVFYPARKLELYKSVPSLTVNPLFSSSFVLHIGDKAIHKSYGKNTIVTVLDLTSNGYVQTNSSEYGSSYMSAKKLIPLKK